MTNLPIRSNSVSLHVLGRVIAGLTAVTMGLAAAGLLVSLVLIAWAVVMRYVFNAAPVWVDEVVGFLLVAIVMLAAAQTLRRGEHIAVDLLTGYFSATGQRLARLWSAATTLAVTLVLIVNGWETASLARSLGLLTEGNLEWPTWWLMLLLPLGGVLMLLVTVEAFWRALLGVPPIPGANHGEPPP